MTQPKTKPVWRMNTGVKPEDKTGTVIFYDNPYIYHGNVWSWHVSDKNKLEIYAYQTTRTKAAKYR